MSGHSKWSQIKHKKGISDQKKGQVFSKLGKKISIAAKGGIDPSTNFRLQAIINEARTANMPKENIERAIKRASDKDASILKEVVIQAMCPGGIAMVIEGITDNSNRTINEVKNILSKNDIKVVPENSLIWMFDKNKNPISPLEITDQNILSKIDRTLEELDANDDIENVYTNIKD